MTFNKLTIFPHNVGGNGEPILVVDKPTRIEIHTAPEARGGTGLWVWADGVCLVALRKYAGTLEVNVDTAEETKP